MGKHSSIKNSNVEIKTAISKVQQKDKTVVDKPIQKVEKVSQPVMAKQERNKVDKPKEDKKSEGKNKIATMFAAQKPKTEKSASPVEKPVRPKPATKGPISSFFTKSTKPTEQPEKSTGES